MPPGEGAPQPEPRIEERILRRFGYEHVIDTSFKIGETPFTGGAFLDAYGSSEHREKTTDELWGFMDMGPNDEGYGEMKTRIANFLGAYFGPPQG